MRRKRTLNSNKLRRPFVALERNFLESPAYRALTSSAAKVYMHMKLRHGINESRGQPDFAFTYRDAEAHGFSKSTFSRAIADLIAKGLIIQAEYGGLRGFCKFENRFQLSDRWRYFGTDRFEEVPRYDQFRMQ